MAGQQQNLRHPGEPRWPAALAILVAIALYTLLPNRLLIGPRFVVPVLEILLFIPIVAANPRRLTKQTKVLRRLDIALLLLIAASNATALVLLIDRMVGGSRAGGSNLLLAAGQIWLTNVLVFALAYWTLDRGGPIGRIQLARPRLPVADFRFPQDEDQDAIIEVAKRSSAKSGWVPGFRRLSLCLGDQFLGVQPDRHYAAVAASEAVDGAGIGVRTAHRGAGDRLRGGPTEVAGDTSRPGVGQPRLPRPTGAPPRPTGAPPRPTAASRPIPAHRSPPR